MNHSNNKKDIILINSLPDACNEKNQTSNLGLVAVESYLAQNGINCALIEIPEIEKYINSSEVFGISVMDSSYKVSRQLTEKLKNKTVIWGGWTATALPELILRDNPGVDYVILQEGEKRFLDLLTSFHQPEIFEKIDGIAYRNDKNKIIVKPPVEFMDMDDLPIPTRPAILKELVFIELSRGCYGRCKYCQDVFQMRFKSAKRVADELQYWYDQSYRNFYLGNANSISKGSLLKELLNELEKRKLFIKVSFVGRPDDVLRNRDILKKYFESKIIDIQSLEIGIEANTQHLLDLLGRGTTPQINQEAMVFLKDLKAKYSPETEIHANMILFSHYDMTIDDFVKNVSFIGEHQCSRDTLSLNLYGVANTPIWFDMKKKGFRQNENIGQQITEYPFTDADVNQLFKKMVSDPLMILKRAGKYSAQTHFEFQRLCYDQILDLYHSPNIKESVIGYLDSSVSEGMAPFLLVLKGSFA